MTVSWGKKLLPLLAFVFLLLPALPAHCHNMPLGGSKWCAGAHGVIANIDLNETLFSELRGLREKRYNYASGSGQELQQIADEFLQPYLSQKIALTVNGRALPVRVDRLVRNDNGIFTIWLSAPGADFSRAENALRIEYRMLFEETNNTHMNLGYFYQSDATGEALQRLFDNSPAQGQFNFTSASPAWELQVKGAAPESAAEPRVPLAPSAGRAKLGAVEPKSIRDLRVAPLQVAGGRQATPEKGAEGATFAAGDPGPLMGAASRAKLAAPAAGAVAPGIAPGGNAPQATPSGAAPSIWPTIGTFLLLGIEHILTGYDHIAFLIGLIVIGLGTREVLKIITAFTLAHSITLLLAALQIIRLDSRFVESVIALSICYIALENLFRKEIKYRWLITFCFGLVHGFGFASALQELVVGQANLVVSVLCFNLGVETGQLMIFFILLPVLHLLRRKVEFRTVTRAVSLAIFILGFTWLIERVFDLNLISS